MTAGKNNAVAVLATAYEAMQAEYDRIDRLLKPNNNNPLGKYAPIITSRFTDPISQASNKLSRIKGSLEKYAQSEEDPKAQEKILEECWSDYFELKTRLMPILSTELLAVIGGVYLRENKLDDTRVWLADSVSGGPEPVSFSDTAEALVRDLATRSGKGWESVLIVGEERFTHSEAEIIRLRFPACDIWNLLFTAHEYGYLVARKKPPERFRDLRDRVRRDVNPTNHRTIGSPPEDKQCFLLEVTEIWDRFHDQLHSDDERQKFEAKNARALTALADAQESYLCRLYADAFATFFIGPAYVLALLYLRFIPDSMNLTGMPAFAERFVFAMETLNWMNDKPVIDAENNRNHFADEVYAQDGIPALWRATLESLKQPDTYQDILNQYQFWLNKIKDSLEAHFSTPNAIGTTYKNWSAVKEIKKKLLEVTPKLSAKPEMWSVLSGAWVARWENRSDLLQIQNTALRLLNDPDVIAPPEKAAPEGLASKQKETITREKAEAKVKTALAKEPNAYTAFREMMSNRRYQRNPEILTALADQDDPRDKENAYGMYVWLYENHG